MPRVNGGSPGKPTVSRRSASGSDHGPYRRSMVASEIVEMRVRRSGARSSAGARRSVSQARRGAAQSADRSVMAATLARAGDGSGVRVQATTTADDPARAAVHSVPDSRAEPVARHGRPASPAAIDDRDLSRLVGEDRDVPDHERRDQLATDHPDGPMTQQEA